ncbi:MAG: hypothetical protein ACI35V_05165 [Sphingobacterium composti]|uniref:hypothetical protein n=1 Tax=Sphingobacterium composti TaxID=363260 RepID=UPI00135AFCAC|nr:hypothetical protein [Sphingobacterium composti Ten et al. 2007 non Yoo et al. 2007]
MKKFLFAIALISGTMLANAQSSYYTIIQGGGNLGFANEGYKGAFNGYSAHFIFGKNYNDRAYLGLGLGNERFKGTYETNDPHHDDFGDKKYSYDQNLFPIFIDGRLPFGEFNASSKIGILANAGYAPKLSAQYDKGVLFKAGFFYLHERPAKTSWTVSAVYGYQQLTKNIYLKDFQHQHFNISVGLMIK